ncbi:Nn.00g078950.m01.CDS01 [Neocucurbitaria sp. VM-36]
MVTTRASAKRGRGNVTDARPTDMEEKAQIKKAKKATSVRSSTAAQDATNTRCRLLELPPEIRNRVYYFTENETRSLYYGPHLRPSRSTMIQETGFRSFISLTQTCQQLRAEYRPLWLGASNALIRMEHLTQFLNTFYPSTADLQHAPKELYLSWNVGVDHKSESYDFTPLLQLHAFKPKFSPKFIPYKVAQQIMPERELCEACKSGDYESDSDDSSFFCFSLDCECGMQSEFNYEDWEIETYDEMEEYTSDLEALLRNGNEAWLKDLREHNISVHCSYDDKTSQWTANIRFRGRSIPEHLRPGKKPIDCAWKYLNERGMFGTGLAYHCLNFTITYGSKSKKKIGDTYMATSTKSYQVHIRSGRRLHYLG